MHFLQNLLSYMLPIQTMFLNPHSQQDNNQMLYLDGDTQDFVDGSTQDYIGS